MAKSQQATAEVRHLIYGTRDGWWLSDPAKLPKGIREGPFPSRQEAVKELTKLQQRVK